MNFFLMRHDVKNRRKFPVFATTNKSRVAQMVVGSVDEGVKKNPAEDVFFARRKPKFARPDRDISIGVC